jgi:hypothetical protein
MEAAQKGFSPQSLRSTSLSAGSGAGKTKE